MKRKLKNNQNFWTWGLALSFTIKFFVTKRNFEWSKMCVRAHKGMLVI